MRVYERISRPNYDKLIQSRPKKEDTIKNHWSWRQRKH